MNTLKHIINKYNLDINQDQLPVEIPNVGRSTLVGWLKEFDFKKGVEIGVASGAYSREICLVNPQMHLTGVDPWISYDGYKDYTKVETFTKLEREARANLEGFSNYTFLKDTSMNAIKNFEDDSLDFVYIDGNHLDPYVTQDITEWYKKIKKGGILAGHDYIRMSGLRFDVKDAINKYTKNNNINPWFVLGVEAKIHGTIRDNSRSWMIIK